MWFAMCPDFWLFYVRLDAVLRITVFDAFLWLGLTGSPDRAMDITRALNLLAGVSTYIASKSNCFRLDVVA